VGRVGGSDGERIACSRTGLWGARPGEDASDCENFLSTIGLELLGTVGTLAASV